MVTRRNKPGLNRGEGPADVERVHNSLVGRHPLAVSLDAPSMSCELWFEAPTTPGEYKVMVHLRSTGCIGVDSRQKVSFTGDSLDTRHDVVT